MGVMVGVVGAFMQTQRVITAVGEYVIVLPWGLLVMLTVLWFVTRFATLATGTSWGAWLFFTGWLAATILLAAE